MLLSSIRQALAALLVAFLVSACGGSGGAAPSPTGGVTVTPGDGAATVTWNSDPGVKYWVFYAPSTSISTTNWTNVPYSVAVLNVTSPYVVSGLTNGVTYSFTINGRTGDGPGGPGSPSVSTVPRPAGATWQPISGVGSNTLRSITYGTNSTDLLVHYLAVGDAGAAYHSLDGLSWAGLDVSVGTNLKAATYTFGDFIVAGAGGVIRYSTDLTVWTTATSSTTQNLNAVSSNGSLAIAVGDNGTMVESANGITWVPVTLPTTNHLYGIAYSGTGLWTAVGANGTVLISSDGANWALATSNTTANLRAVTVQYIASYRVVAAGDNGTIISSDDNGITWNTQVSGTTANLLAINSTSSQILASGSGGAVITSPDGTTWTKQTAGTTADLFAIASGILAQYIVVGQGGTAIYSR